MSETRTIKSSTLICCSGLLILFILVSCRKDVPKGKLIQANGYVIDSFKNKKLPEATIYLIGAHQTLYGIYYDIGPLDSTISDANGNFSIKYTAQGNVVDYALSVGSAEYGGYTFQNNYVVDVNHPYYPFYYSARVNNVVVMARELNYAKLNLKVLSNPYDSLYLLIGSSYGEFELRYLLVGESLDTSILTRYLPYSQNSIDYEIQTQALLDSGAYARILSDTLAPNSQDTLVINKTINSTYDIPITN